MAKKIKKEQTFDMVDKYIEEGCSTDLDKLKDRLIDVNIRLRDKLKEIELLAHRIDDIWTGIATIKE